jgi:hypothetical protein
VKTHDRVLESRAHRKKPYGGKKRGSRARPRRSGPCRTSRPLSFALDRFSWREEKRLKRERVIRLFRWVNSGEQKPGQSF